MIHYSFIYQYGIIGRTFTTWSARCRSIMLLLSLLILQKATGQAAAQLTLEQCYTLAENNYPLIRQIELLENTKNYSLENAAKGNFPQFNIAGQATYQSEVTSIPISLPGIQIEGLSKDQYKLYAEIYQPLTEKNNVHQQKESIKANIAAEQQKVRVELHKLKDRISQLFFGMLLADAQMEQARLSASDVQANLKKINAAVSNGTATQMNADLLRAELLKIDQRIIELQANRKSAADVLEIFIQQSINDSTVFVKTSPEEINTTAFFMKRPEMSLYALQKSIIDVQLQQIKNRYIPKVGLFLQGGLGRPALNMLNNDMSAYYIGGLRLNWNLSAWYTAKNDKAILQSNAQAIELQQSTFLLNTQVVAQQQYNDIVKYQNLINNDQEAIDLRQKIKQTAAAQLENGIITSLDYITYLNAEEQARQNLLLHQIQLLMAIQNLKNTKGE